MTESYQMRKIVCYLSLPRLVRPYPSFTSHLLQFFLLLNFVDHTSSVRKIALQDTGLMKCLHYVERFLQLSYDVKAPISKANETLSSDLCIEKWIAYAPTDRSALDFVEAQPFQRDLLRRLFFQSLLSRVMSLSEERNEFNLPWRQLAAKDINWLRKWF